VARAVPAPRLLGKR